MAFDLVDYNGENGGMRINHPGADLSLVVLFGSVYDSHRPRRRRHRHDQMTMAATSTRSSRLLIPANHTVIQRRRMKRSPIFFDLHDLHHMHYHDNQCSHHRIDHCAWPQCNLSCPKIHNPFTGEEMDFIDLLMQFGLDLSSVADALDMDMLSLQTMDHAKLLRILTRDPL
ncbi:hypothetical protein LSH36_1096g00011 [Paralvinella palmiformis]|uniref:Uncharacterized protein n=1 Tax=Paralvinella palmiformis TaxID=53620 RepID=A0AAD9MRS5_9ANNE|nr:hypothetical protein LSH36_1096g00011 [Paralvinella palmiformis]